ncbi:MAG: hypothetical protein A3C93_01390 [Candidatus Lloydbacteria bacterium RIFCSPHIGHO2_02_FULL_54_17]|uniref:HD/PDEase domain-containing protein n=1 Tax=Candidatus Lloydbacteria bacterium RIFCSPHIGHO2_02_FULL_54_17 TaxID=1798664 RepID=A0A1G2DBK1_9BACT|nr:MAG: hypothetical protein A2762_04655 [Candidatus Lloydbacteria bacterium RIFCSPHIGHO2_01_FULL_54_11]OGZ10986.1 MAG: hypothetical protein A3C93_01390 [Candidatus Lloydbacteria bacterium RIFCSPHIGHO2_02_FULL_54_17]
MPFESEVHVLAKVDRVIASRSPKRDLFRHIRRFLDQHDEEYREIEEAYRVSRRACKNRRREDGTAAFGHGRSVALIQVACMGIKDPDQIKAALLHDVVEDIRGWSHERVERQFGPKVVYYTRWVSKDPRTHFRSKEERDRVYQSRFRRAPKAVLVVKLPDVLHNLRTLFACDRKKQERIVLVARRVYLPLAERHGILVNEIEAAIRRVEKGWSPRRVAEDRAGASIR